MTDRIKGVLITFEKDICDDDAKPIIEALEMIKGVLTVKPYVTGMEDYMLYQKGHMDARKQIFEFLKKEPKNPKNEIG
jgi:hypothetical protein